MKPRPAPQGAAGWANLDSDGFELAAVLPEQYHGNVREWTGEQKLLAAILVDAVRQARKGSREAWAWIDSARCSKITNFESICLLLGMDAATIRRRLNDEARTRS